VALTVVVPTRNRPDLAVAAVRSLLEPEIAGMRVVVSDNSSEPGLRNELERACREWPSDQVTYVRPEASMSFTGHWEWALQRALEVTPATHIAFLTDRMVVKQGRLEGVLQTVAAHPERVVSYDHDRVEDASHPVRLLRCASTRKLFEVDARHLLQMSARVILSTSLPRMMNSIVPVGVIERVRERFGTVFDSVSPDFCFAFRCLAVVDNILFLDDAVLLHRALDRSNGASYARGVPSADSADFEKQLGRRPRNHAAPVPEFETITNAIVHEYCVVRAEARSPRFPEVDRPSYLAAIAQDLRGVEDPRIATLLRQQLAAHGWADGLQEGAVADDGRPRWRRRAARVARDPGLVPERVWQSTVSSYPAREAWRALSRADIRPPASVIFRFPSTSAAIKYNNAVGTRLARQPSPRELLGGAVEVGDGDRLSAERSMVGGDAHDEP